MAPKKVEQKKKVLRFGFIIHDAVDYEINKKTPEIIDSNWSASLIKALELVKRQHYGCNCYHCKLYKMIIEILLERTLDCKEKEPPFPFYNNRRFKYVYDIDGNYIW